MTNNKNKSAKTATNKKRNKAAHDTPWSVLPTPLSENEQLDRIERKLDELLSRP